MGVTPNTEVLPSDMAALATLANSKTALAGRPYSFPDDPLVPASGAPAWLTELKRLRNNLAANTWPAGKPFVSGPWPIGRGIIGSSQNGPLDLVYDDPGYSLVLTPAFGCNQSAIANEHTVDGVNFDCTIVSNIPSGTAIAIVATIRASFISPYTLTRATTNLPNATWSAVYGPTGDPQHWYIVITAYGTFDAATYTIGITITAPIPAINNPLYFSLSGTSPTISTGVTTAGIHSTKAVYKMTNLLAPPGDGYAQCVRQGSAILSYVTINPPQNVYTNTWFFSGYGLALKSLTGLGTPDAANAAMPWNGGLGTITEKTGSPIPRMLSSPRYPYFKDGETRTCLIPGNDGIWGTAAQWTAWATPWWWIYKVALNRNVIKMPWLASHAYAIDDLIWDGTYWQKCTTAGTSGSSAPAFSATVGNTTADGSGTLVWTNMDTGVSVTLGCYRSGSFVSFGTFKTGQIVDAGWPIFDKTALCYQCAERIDVQASIFGMGGAGGGAVSFGLAIGYPDYTTLVEPVAAAHYNDVHDILATL